MFLCVLVALGTLGCLELRFLCQKYDFYTSGQMNTRLSVHGSLKRAIGRSKPSCTLGARLAARLSVMHLHYTLGCSLKRAAPAQ